MTLNLSSETRKANYYLSEIDKLAYKLNDVAGETATQLDELQDQIVNTQNVKYYGAIGDGVADDTLAIQECIVANDSRVYFPNGIYRITGELLVNAKIAFQIYSDNAIILQDHSDITLYCLKLTNCEGFAINGRLILESAKNVASFVTNDISLGCGNGLYVINCKLGTYDNITVLGPFLKGLHFVINNPNDTIPQNISGANITNCGIGILLASEYYTVNAAMISYCHTGITITGGNNSVVSSTVSINRIGIFVLGLADASKNTDHGKIIGCTTNHNQACGIFIKNTKYSFHVTGCEIWANIGPETLTTGVEIISAVTSSFGVYLLDVENINFTGNVVARNPVNMGLDGYCVCNISNNSFMTDSGRTTRHMIEYGGRHLTSDGFGTNAQNIISNNTFYGNLTGGPTDGFRMKFFDNTGPTLDDNSSTVFSNNRGTTGSNLLSIGSGNTSIVKIDQNYDHITINGITGVNGDIQLHSSMGGVAFDIIIVGLTGGQTREVRFATFASHNWPESHVIVGPSTPVIAYNPTQTTGKKYTFSANGKYSFIPNGPFLGNHTIICPQAYA